MTFRYSGSSAMHFDFFPSVGVEKHFALKYIYWAVPNL